MPDNACQGVFFSSYKLNEPIKDIAWTKNYICYAPWQYYRFFIDLVGDFDGYLSNLKSKTRGTLKRKVKKYESKFGKDEVCKTYSTVSEVDEFLRLALDVSLRTYQHRLLDAGLPTGDCFREEVYQRASNHGMRGYILFADKKAVSYLYGRVDHNGVFYYDYLGYDPEFQKMSPGAVLHYYAIKNMFSDVKIRYFDFTQGGGQHKATFGQKAYY